MTKPKPPGWLPTKPSPHQIHMLRMFSKGWVFRLRNKCPGSWNTYWVLLRKGWCEHVGEGNALTEKGRAVLARYGKDLQPMEMYYREAMTGSDQ